MKERYDSLAQICLLTKAIFLLAFVWFYTGARAQIYNASLSGAKQSPPNISNGTGYSTVTIDGDMMRVQVSFGGLSGATTACHIHAPTTEPGTGNTGVATPTPSFPGFPNGVSIGSYDMTFDMSLTSSYNASFIANNGGTASSASAALKAAFEEGKAYLNIHTTNFAGGEIRGFYAPSAYRNLRSLETFVNLPDAISKAMTGDTIQQINDAMETAPIDLPTGFNVEFQIPYILVVNVP